MVDNESYHNGSVAKYNSATTRHHANSDLWQRINAIKQCFNSGPRMTTPFRRTKTTFLSENSFRVNATLNSYIKIYLTTTMPKYYLSSCSLNIRIYYIEIKAFLSPPQRRQLQAWCTQALHSTKDASQWTALNTNLRAGGNSFANQVSLHRYVRWMKWHFKISLNKW